MVTPTEQIHIWKSVGTWEVGVFEWRVRLLEVDRMLDREGVSGLELLSLLEPTF